MRLGYATLVALAVGCSVFQDLDELSDDRPTPDAAGGEEAGQAGAGASGGSGGSGWGGSGGAVDGAAGNGGAAGVGGAGGSGVSLSADVMPVFAARGCTVCHSGSSVGADLGNLALDGSLDATYHELTGETSPKFGTTRVNLADPASSLLLTMPSAEEPPDAHPNVTFSGPSDPDYVTILSWIQDGAPQN